MAFSDIENRALAKNSETKERKELIKYIERLGILPRLRAFAVSTKHLGEHKNSKFEYFLLLLEIDKSNIKVFRYPTGHLDAATEKYAELESMYKDNPQKDVVLVSAESVRGLKKAYPNYFADTSEFSKNIEKVIEANKTLQRTSR
jgi:hypothetical protein